MKENIKSGRWGVRLEIRMIRIKFKGDSNVRNWEVIVGSYLMYLQTAPIQLWLNRVGEKKSRGD